MKELGGAAASSLYLHVPFCFHKCHYCDFYSIVDENRQGAFVDRLLEEIAAVGPLLQSPISTLFIGGGTPTLLEVAGWQRLLESLKREFRWAASPEFTVEANPETIRPELLDVLMQGGVNRLSIGAQSFDPRHLKTLERWHDPVNVQKAVAMAQSAGFKNLNLDLIFAIPGQSMEDLDLDLDQAMALQPDHLSAYSLTYEPQTPLRKKLELGKIQAMDEEMELAMLRRVAGRMQAGGYERYEISNFARPGKACRHNLAYWRNQNWMALGPSASGHLNGWRWKNVPHLGQYLASRGGAPVQDVESPSADRALGEELMMGLRLQEGVYWGGLKDRLDDRRRRKIADHLETGLLEKTEEALRFSDRGWQVADSVLVDLI